MTPPCLLQGGVTALFAAACWYSVNSVISGVACRSLGGVFFFFALHPRDVNIALHNMFPIQAHIVCALAENELKCLCWSLLYGHCWARHFQFK